nr:unnamed protein product [Digitaria exilis]
MGPTATTTTPAIDVRRVWTQRGGRPFDDGSSGHGAAAGRSTTAPAAAATWARHVKGCPTTTRSPSPARRQHPLGGGDREMAACRDAAAPRELAAALREVAATAA